MNFQKATLIATSMVAFSTSLGVLIALVSFIYNLGKFNFIELILYSEMYISLHLLFLYMLKRLFK